MRLYSKMAGSERRIRFGIDLMHRLDHFEEARELEKEFAAPQGRLREAFERRQAIEVELLKGRSDVAVREMVVDRQIRKFAHIVRAVGNGPQSSLFQAMFPKGLTDVVRPQGTRQLEPLAALTLRLTEHASAEPLRKDWLAPMTALRDRFEEAVDALAQTQSELREAFDRERVTREEHRAAVKRVEGGLMRLYATDRTMMKVFQPVLGLPKSGPKPAIPEAA